MEESVSEISDKVNHIKDLSENPKTLLEEMQKDLDLYQNEGDQEAAKRFSDNRTELKTNSNEIQEELSAVQNATEDYYQNVDAAKDGLFAMKEELMSVMVVYGGVGSSSCYIVTDVKQVELPEKPFEGRVRLVHNRIERISHNHDPLFFYFDLLFLTVVLIIALYADGFRHPLDNSCNTKLKDIVGCCIFRIVVNVSRDNRNASFHTHGLNNILDKFSSALVEIGTA